MKVQIPFEHLANYSSYNTSDVKLCSGGRASKDSSANKHDRSASHYHSFPSYTFTPKENDETANGASNILQNKLSYQ